MGFKNNINVSSRLRKLAISYGIIWAVLVLSFWPFYNNSQMAMLHVIVVQYVALPIIIFVFSVIVATIHIPLRYRRIPATRARYALRHNPHSSPRLE